LVVFHIGSYSKSILQPSPKLCKKNYGNNTNDQLKKSRSQLLVESEKNKSTKEQSGKEGK